MAAVHAGDTLVVSRLDRLARSLPDARAIADELSATDVSLSLGGSTHDLANPVGRLVFNALIRFRRLFEATVEQCIAAGLAWGQELHVDSTDVAGNAAHDSLRPRFAVEAHLVGLFPGSAGPGTPTAAGPAAPTAASPTSGPARPIPTPGRPGAAPAPATMSNTSSTAAKPGSC